MPVKPIFMRKEIRTVSPEAIRAGSQDIANWIAAEDHTWRSTLILMSLIFISSAQ
jgi:hypothetical protein